MKENMKRILWISVLAYAMMVYVGQVAQARALSNEDMSVMASMKSKKKSKAKKQDVAKMACQCCKEKSIVILYENDVHCAIERYSKLAGLRNAISDTADVAVVCCGDFIQGGTPGAISKGQYVIDVMDAVHYDAVTLGNHEFDYGTPRMFELLRRMASPVVNTNLYEFATGRNVFSPYTIKRVGDKRVAFVGVTTPSTMEAESYAFYDDAGNLMYDLQHEDVYAQVQEAANSARRAGADYVVVISHLGEIKTKRNVDSHGLVANTKGIDVVLDGHTHSVIQADTVLNKVGKPILVTQTGTKFQNIGKLLITPDGKFSTTLLPIESVLQEDLYVAHVIDSVKGSMNEVTSRKICHSDVPLRILDDAGKQAVRMRETNAGDLVADAYRYVTGAELAVLNGGGIRTELKAGDLTYGDLVALLPYDNYLMQIEAKGSTIVDMLTDLMSDLPDENGQFPQVSGLKFTVHASAHSVSDVMVLNAQTQQYEPIDPDRTYTLGTTDYCVTGGGLNNKLKGSKVLKDAMMIYSDGLIEYVTKGLNGHIGEQYAQPQGRITMVD